MKMKVNNEFKILFMMSMSLLIVVECICPNNCSGHGKCVGSVCECYNSLGLDKNENYGGADCSERICFGGNPFGAIHSSLASESGSGGGSGSVRVLRELNVKNNKTIIRELSVVEEEPYYEVKLLNRLDTAEVSRLWKVSGLEMIVENLPLSGGILNCKYYKKVDESSSETVQDSPTTLDIQSYGDGYQYVLFDKATSGFGVGTNDGKYSKVECNKVITSRYDLSQVNPPLIPSSRRLLSSNNNTRELEATKFTWTGYGPILKDMGLLEVDTTEKTKYISDKFSFACYPTTLSSPSTNTEVTIYTGVSAEYTEDGENSFDVNFAITGTTEKPAPSANSICLCLMNLDGSIGIEYSDAFDNMRKGDGNDANKYFIGKYAKVDSNFEFEKENGYDVIKTTEITSETTEITFSSLNDDKKYYVDVNRVLYATVLTNGIFKEYEVGISSVDSDTQFTIKAIDGSGVIMPYLRTFPIDELTQLPTPNIELKPADGQTSPPYRYKSYYFAEDLLKSMNNEGGKLNCIYNSEEIEIDVKGIAKNEKVIFFSYFESEVEIDTNDVSKLNCNEKLSDRKDSTLLYPSAFEVSRRQRQLAAAGNMEWTKYGNMFNDFGITANVKFGCFNMNSQTKQINEYTANAVVEANNDKVTFSSISGTFEESDVGTYLCFLLHQFSNPSKPLQLSGLPTSEIGNRIKVEGEVGSGQYYYGEFIIGTKTEIKKRESDGSEVIVLSKNSVITLTDPQSSSITISGYSNIKTEINNKLKKEDKFYLKMINTKDSFDEKFVKFTSEGISEDESAGTITVTISTTETITDYLPYYVIYLSNEIPTEIPTTQPPIPPTIITIDKSKYLYKIHNYISDELLNDLSIIGGKLQCKSVNENNIESVEIVDVKGIIKKENEIIGGFYQFENENSKERIESCKIISNRKDMSLYYHLNI